MQAATYNLEILDGASAKEAAKTAKREIRGYKVMLNEAELKAHLRELRITTHPWLCDVPEAITKQAVKDLLGAYRKAFKNQRENRVVMLLFVGESLDVLVVSRDGGAFQGVVAALQVGLVFFELLRDVLYGFAEVVFCDMRLSCDAFCAFDCESVQACERFSEVLGPHALSDAVAIEQSCLSRRAAHQRMTASSSMTCS
jgi:hypothetical protein